MSRHNLKHLEPYRDTKPPPSWSALDAEYYTECNQDTREVLYLRDEPTLAQTTARWLWGISGFVLGLVTATVLFATGGGK